MRPDENVHVDDLDSAIAEIEERIEELESDDRYPESPEENAQVQVNAPLALIQQDMQSEVKGLKKALSILEDHHLY